MIRSVWKVGFSYSGRTTSLTTDWVVWTLLALPCHLMSSHSSCGQLSNISQNSCPSCLPNVSPGIHSALLSFFLYLPGTLLWQVPIPLPHPQMKTIAAKYYPSYSDIDFAKKLTPFIFIHKTPKRCFLIQHHNQLKERHCTQKSHH